MDTEIYICYLHGPPVDNLCSLSTFTFSFFQRYPTDQAYFIAKEILMTERTYKKDLEIINLVRKTFFLDFFLVFSKKHRITCFLLFNSTGHEIVTKNQFLKVQKYHFFINKYHFSSMVKKQTNFIS